MAGNAGTYLQSARLSVVKGTNHPAAPANLYLALYTVAPANDGTSGTEVSGGSYARQAIASSGWSAISGASPSQISNSGVIAFPTATAAWGTIVAWALWDALTGGHLWYTQMLVSSKTIGNTDSMSFAAGSIPLAED